ncbi:MAG: hypothetical protein II007_03145 [Gammaproteobacteria bacterium]|nr:hypothetical protein [Gammaproteobacteria bacterium]
MNQELRSLLESFISGENQSLLMAQKIESIICIEYAEDHPLQELAEFLAQYRPGGGEFLYSETETAQEISRWLKRFPQNKT